jgi:hypothetical protein
MGFVDIIAVYYENRKKPIHRLQGRNTRLSNVKAVTDCLWVLRPCVRYIGLCNVD